MELVQHLFSWFGLGFASRSLHFLVESHMITEGPVCVVKRFRRTTGTAEPDPQPSNVDHSQDSSFSLVSDPGVPDAANVFELFGAQSEAGFSASPSGYEPSEPAHSQFRARWNDQGDYDFFYEPGGTQPHFTGLGPRSVDWERPPLPSGLPMHVLPRRFESVPFRNASTAWSPPELRRKYREGTPTVLQSAQPHAFQLGSNRMQATRQMCPDAAVVRVQPPPVQASSPTSSMQQAWYSAKHDLIQQWLQVLDQMGDMSGLFSATASSTMASEHRQRVVEKFAPSTLQTYFRIWSRWYEFATTLKACPFQPPIVLLADFLAEHAHGPLGVATGYYKGLSWMARQAQLPLLLQALQASVCKAYLRSAIIAEKRESAPLPLSFVIFLERTILAKSTSAGDILQLGGILFLIWASLRWSDATWIAPDSISIQQHALFALATHTKTTNRGMPVACYAFGLLGHQGSNHWAQIWLNVVQQAAHDTRALYPEFGIDFLLAEIGPDTQKPLFLRPMPRDRGLQLLRFWLCRCHEAHQTPAKPEDFHLLGTHSCKTTLLCWAQQLQLPLEQRQLQGHHRAALNKSVALYSRNDTLPALMLQCTVAQKIAEGFRPLRPLLRGGCPALPDFAISVPPWRPLPNQAETIRTGLPDEEPQPEIASADLSDDEHSEASEESDVEAQTAEVPEVPDEVFFLYNPITKVAHIAQKCDLADRAVCYTDAGSVPFRTACGVRPNAISGDLQFVVQLPGGARLCLRSACAKFISPVV